MPQSQTVELKVVFTKPETDVDAPLPSVRRALLGVDLFLRGYHVQFRAGTL